MSAENPRKRTLKSGKVSWEARYRDPAGRHRSKSFPLKKEAVAFLEDRRREIRRGEWIDPDDEGTTVRQLAQEWMERAAKPETKDSRKSLLISLGPLGDMPVGAVRSSHISAWRAKLLTGRDWLPEPKPGHRDRRTLSEGSAANALGQLMTILKLAHEDQMISRVPVVRERKSAPLRAVSRADLLSVEDVARVAEAARVGRGRAGSREWLRVMILVAAGTGMRVSELCGLQVGDVDFLRGTVRVRRQIGRQLAVTAPKSAASTRDIPVARWVTDELSEWLRSNPPALEGWVWSRPGGVPHDRNSATHALQAVVRVHGLRASAWHDFRHFFASALIFGGAPVNSVQAAMGHASASVTLEVYAHLFPGQDDLVRSAGAGLAAVRDFGGIRDGKKPRTAG